MNGATIVDILADEFAVEVSDPETMVRVAVRLTLAVGLAAILGFERERRESAAGLRTYMLVALGTALFVLAPQVSGLDEDAMSRVLQGIIAGIGFLGAGTILKRTERVEVRGLTTAAGIWATAAIAVACAVGRVWLAIVSTVAAYVVLAVMLKIEARTAMALPKNDARQ